MVLECSQHPAAFFVTLTYKDSELPIGGNLSKRDVQLYLKRLREDVEPRRIRYFAVGEYGERFGRPHYHLALYGALVPREIRSAWLKGRVDISLLGMESAAYISGYILKAGMASEKAADGREPEFRLMSRRPGIGGLAGDALGRDLRRYLSLGDDVQPGIRLGDKAFPIGRYLRERMRAAAGVVPDVVRRRRDIERGLMLKVMTSKDVEDLKAMREKDKVKGERAASRAAAVQRYKQQRKL